MASAYQRVAPPRGRPIPQYARPSMPSAPPRSRWSARRDELERRAGRARCCRVEVAAHLREGGPVQRDGAGQAAEARPRRRRSDRRLRSRRRRRQPARSAAVSSSSTPATSSGRQQRAGIARPPGPVGAAKTSVRDGVEPAAQRRLLPAPRACRGSPARSGRRPARRRRRASACWIASAGSPCCSNQSLARRCSAGDLRPGCSAARCAQHVGEQVVVAVPAALVVEGDDEQVAAVERLERRARRRLRR